MEIGIDSFAAFVTDKDGNPVGTAQNAMRELLERIKLADEKGWMYLLLANIIERNFWIRQLR